MPIDFLDKMPRACEMCGQYKMKAPFYQWKSIITDCEMVVCHRCAMREEFGNSYKQNKRYQRWIENGE